MPTAVYYSVLNRRTQAMPVFIDLTGQRFGRLVAVKPAAHTPQGVYWKCLCDCGRTITVRSGNLRGRIRPTRSCGCLHFTDLTGKRFTRLVVVSRAGSRWNKALWKCLCDCGNVITVNTRALTTQNTRSCGCLYNHGMTLTREYNTWKSMKGRCFNPNNPAYLNYGGRGIRVCPRWHDFRNFLADMGTRPEGHSIDRINRDGNYEPGNCRWADPMTQTHNRRPVKKRAA